MVMQGGTGLQAAGDALGTKERFIRRSLVLMALMNGPLQRLHAPPPSVQVAGVTVIDQQFRTPKRVFGTKSCTRSSHTPLTCGPVFPSKRESGTIGLKVPTYGAGPPAMVWVASSSRIILPTVQF